MTRTPPLDPPPLGPAVLTPGQRRRAVLGFCALAVALLVWANWAVPALGGLLVERTARNTALALALLALASAAGLGRRELGLSRDGVLRGAGWGAAAAGVVAAGYVVAVLASLVVPALGRLISGGGDQSTSALLLGALVHVPLGTVLWEEVAFRGVLLTLALRALRPGWAVVVTSLVFSAWHAHGALAGVLGDLGGATAGQVGAAAGVFAVTAAGGAVFAWLRIRSGSLLAPMGLHLATNSLGMLVAAALRGAAWSS